MSAIWIFSGVWLVVNGRRALGPTVSTEGGFVLLTIVAALVGVATATVGAVASAGWKRAR